jgi:peptidoglycan/LPS O-acetylase OafA/YrhL
MPAATADTRGRRLQYQPALDGIRALAVAAVLAYHADLPFARGGFLGVDAFFVLSGYLITSLLLAEWRENGRINFAAFWARRARRLLPALFLMLAGIAAYALLFAEPSQLDKLRGDALATLGYVANWRLAFSGESYFDMFSVPSPLRHTWSLAIEEQWYVVWPLLVGLLLWWRRGSMRLVFVLAVAIVAGSALLMAWMFDPEVDPSRVFYGTDTRAQSLVVGAVLAMLLARHGPLRGNTPRLLLQLTAAACFAYAGWLWVATPDSSAFLYQGGFLLSALAVAVVITAVVQPQAGPLSRLLSVEPLRWLGLISYGVYLWHWPIYLVLTPERTGLDSTSLLAPRVALTLAVATASYFLLEMPVRRGALRTWRPSWAVAPAMSVVLAVGLVISTRGGAPLLQFGDLLTMAAKGDTASAPTRVLIVGDSIAWTISPGLYSRQEEQNFAVRHATIVACGIIRGNVPYNTKPRNNGCEKRLELWRSELEEFDPDVVVVLSGFWDARDHEVNGRTFEFGTPEADEQWLSEMQVNIDLLSSRGAQVVILSSPYFPEDNLPAERIDRLNDLYRQAACQNQDSVTFLDLNRFLYPTGKYASTIDGVQVRNDGFHFSLEGADMVGRWLAPKISSIARGDAGTAGSVLAADQSCGRPQEKAAKTTTTH